MHRETWKFKQSIPTVFSPVLLLLRV